MLQLNTPLLFFKHEYSWKSAISEFLFRQMAVGVAERIVERVVTVHTADDTHNSSKIKTILLMIHSFLLSFKTIRDGKSIDGSIILLSPNASILRSLATTTQRFRRIELLLLAA